MNCPICGEKTKVTDSRMKGNRIRRTRECKDCFTKFNTFEGMDFNSLPDYIKSKLEVRQSEPVRNLQR